MRGLLPQGDAEDLPFPTDSFDRYVSAGSIGASTGADTRACNCSSLHCLVCGSSWQHALLEHDSCAYCAEYWPEPQRGIKCVS